MIQIGNGNWAVKEDNLLGFRYDETEGVYFPREMTFGRACDATRVNPDGLIERVPYNLAQYSEELPNAVWTKLFATITSNATTAPNGTLTADKIVEDTTASQLHRCGQGGISVTSGAQYTFSFYAKAAERFILELQRINTSGTVFNTISETLVNLTNGTISAGSNIDASSITSVGNGWYRISITLTAIATGSGGLNIGLCDASGNYSYTGNGVSGAYIWGFQVNEGTTAKPYFPTTNRQDIARIDYSSGTGALLLEPQRTNLVTYSEQFDNGVWSKVRSSISANVVTSPDGTQNADKLIEDTTASASHFVRGGTYSFTSGTTYTITIYAKSSERQIGFNTDASVGAVSPCLFDLVDGTIQSNGNFTTSINLVGNGWYRCVGTFTATATATAYVYFRMGLNDSTAYTGDGTSGVYLWGAQLEASSYPTSYIPTTSATVTRLADSCFKTGVADWIGQTEGTLFVDYQSTNNGGNGERIFAISDGTAANRIVLFDQLGKIRIYTATGSVVQWDTTTAINTKGHHKIAVGYKANDAVLYIDGTQITNDTSYSVPACSAVYVGTSEAYGISLAGSVNQATVYKTRLSNSELAALTTI